MFIERQHPTRLSKLRQERHEIGPLARVTDRELVSVSMSLLTELKGVWGGGSYKHGAPSGA